MPDLNDATSNSSILNELRGNYDYAKQYWDDIYKEGRKDMRYVSGDPWPSTERIARTNQGRLCLAFDELNQYLNTAINDVRKNKRAVKVTAKGDGANDQTALMRAAIIRGQEYQCKASSVYAKAYESVLQRSYGFITLRTDYESPRSRHQQYVIECPANPETILIDPDGKRTDGEDMGYAFQIEGMSEQKFKFTYPDAEIQSFTTDHMREAPSWITDTPAGKRVIVCLYWKLKRRPRKLVYLANGRDVFLDQMPGAAIEGREGSAGSLLFGGQQVQYVGWRKSDDATVVQYQSNGIEVLGEPMDWAGSSIPIMPLFGKEIFVESDESGQAKRVILSAVRLARDPYLAYCYCRTTQTEVAGMSSKIPYEGYEGQFDTNTDFENINRALYPYAEFKGKTEATGDNLLPLPRRNNWEPPIQAYEILAESAKKAIQSAMGIMGLLNGHVDASAKSGVALKELDEQQSQGTFHFVDSLDSAIERVGRIMDQTMSKVMPDERDVPIVKKNDEGGMLHINGPGKHPETGEDMQFNTEDGDHAVTISTGPSSDSQRTLQNDFADQIAGNPAVVEAAIGGNKTASKLLSMSIKLKDLGHLGDEMADIIAPPDEGQQDPQLQKAGMLIEKQTAEIHELAKKLEDKNAELQLKKYTVDQQEQTKREALAIKVDAEAVLGKLEQEIGVLRDKHERLHAAHMQATQHLHENLKAEQDRAAAQQQQESAQAATAGEGDANRQAAADQADQAAQAGE